ncbi:MAG TPA: hypothetical protein DER07_07445 [Armatimonadetes bacterium]|nr:hypothetical protein [Armatimonadota bacterium]
MARRFLAILLLALGVSVAAAQTFRVRYDAAAYSGPFTGSVAVYVSKTMKEPRLGPSWVDPEPVLVAHFADVGPGRWMVLDATTVIGGRKRIEAIQGTTDPELYRGERYGRLTYTIPVPPGSTYTAVFHFAETWFGSQGGGGGAGSRLFDVLCNGVLLERELDVYREAGGAFRALRRTYRGLKPTPNGKLVFQLVPGRNYAFLNALEILDEGRRPIGQHVQK